LNALKFAGRMFFVALWVGTGNGPTLQAGAEYPNQLNSSLSLLELALTAGALDGMDIANCVGDFSEDRFSDAILPTVISSDRSSTQ
jgi:hypothetical protein